MKLIIKDDQKLTLQSLDKPNKLRHTYRYEGRVASQGDSAVKMMVMKV